MSCHLISSLLIVEQYSMLVPVPPPRIDVAPYQPMGRQPLSVRLPPDLRSVALLT
jgi:hypothetical protein